MTDIDQRIEAEVAAKMRIHNLKQAHTKLHDVRNQVRAAILLIDGESEITGILGGMIVNPLESAMWKIEQAIREDRAGGS